MPAVRLALGLVVALWLAVAFMDWRALRADDAAPAHEDAPAPLVPAAEANPDFAALPLFGRLAAPPAADGAAATALADASGLPESSASYRLFGVLLAPGSNERFALLGNSEGTQDAYREGDAAPDGARLVLVKDGYVVLERNGLPERLPLADASGTGEPGDAGLPAAAAQAPDVGAPLAPTANPAAAALRARLNARRAAAQAGQSGPENN